MNPRGKLALLAIGFAFLIVLPAIFLKKLFVRGLRNNNPFNLKISDEDWFGKVPLSENTDGTFEQFFQDEDGFRAGMRNYWLDFHGPKQLQTLSAIIEDNTPASENDTPAYIASVAEGLGIDPDQPFNWDSVKYKLAKLIVIEENGSQPFSDEFVMREVDRAETSIS